MTLCATLPPVFPDKKGAPGPVAWFLYHNPTRRAAVCAVRGRRLKCTISLNGLRNAAVGPTLPFPGGGGTTPP